MTEKIKMQLIDLIDSPGLETGSEHLGYTHVSGLHLKSSDSAID